jgi:hypothetical protein
MNKEMKFKLIRDVTSKECRWLDKTFKEGEIVYLYYGCTYGCCKDSAYTEEYDKTPFFELPNNAVEIIKEETI